VTLSDLEGRDMNGQTSSDDLRHYATIVSPTAITFGTITRVGERRVSRSDTPILRQRGSSVPKNWDPY